MRVYTSGALVLDARVRVAPVVAHPSTRLLVLTVRIPTIGSSLGRRCRGLLPRPSRARPDTTVSGGAEGGAPSAVYLATLLPDAAPFLTWERADGRRQQFYDELAELGGDMARSLWDTRNLLFVFDLDYLNIDSQGSAFVSGPDVRDARAHVPRGLGVLRHFGIRPFRLMTGRGYHFLGRIPLIHPIIDVLAALPSVPHWHPRSTRVARPGST